MFKGRTLVGVGAAGRGTVVFALVGAVSGALGQSVYFVDAAAAAGGDGSTWAQAARDLQTALAAARSAGSAVRTIRVAGGMYKPDGGTGDRNASFDLVSGVTVRGGYAGASAPDPDARDLFRHATTLSGDLGGDDIGSGGPRGDNTLHVVRATATSDMMTLEGVVVVGGAANGNDADRLGGGMLIDGGRDRVIVSHCRFLGNTAIRGGGLYSMNAGPRVQQCVFAWNTASYGSGAVIEGTSANQPAALIANCTFANNLSQTDESQGGYGEGLYGLLIEAGAPRAMVVQCVAGGNTSSRGLPYPIQYKGYLSYQRCHTVVASGGLPGGAFDVVRGDPGFVNPLGVDGIAGTVDDDFRLRPGSICADAGDGSLILADVSDIDGDGDRNEPCPLDAGLGPRRLDDGAAVDWPGSTAPVIDLGAFEGPALSVMVDQSSPTIAEGGSASWWVTLNRSPGPAGADVVIQSNDDSAVITPDSMTFVEGDWSTPRRLRVFTLQDADFVSDTIHIGFSGDGVAATSVSFTEVDDDAAPGVLRVRPGAPVNGSGATWADAVPTLTRALTLATQFPNITEIWLAGGVYRTTSVNGFQARNRLRIVGGFAGTEVNADQRPTPLLSTVVSGDVLGNDGPGFVNRTDNSRFALTFLSGPGSCALEGVTVSGGHGIVNGNGNGGGLLVDFAAVASLENCRFTDNQGRGAYVNVAAGSVTVLGCTFSNNETLCENATASGGGLRLEGYNVAASGLVDGCVFESNTALSGGGLTSSLSALVLRNSRFTSNMVADSRQFSFCGASDGGGGVLLNQSMNNPPAFEITNCVFDGNLADGSTRGNDGGGLMITGRCAGTITGCTFTHNRAPLGVGGGFRSLLSNPLNDPIAVFMSGCTFDGNSAAGGAGLLGGEIFQVSNCTFKNHTGGAQVVNISTPISGCVFEDNAMTSSGGALATQSKVSNCTFRRNSGTEGGGVLGDFGNTEVMGCLFESNSATTGNGGAVWNAKRIVNSVFVGNHAGGRGGAVYLCRSVANCRFIDNHAAGDGGAIFDGQEGGVANCAFSLNSGARGGAVFIEYADRRSISGCTVIDNSATVSGGGFYLEYPSPSYMANVVNSILWNNSDPSGLTEAAQIAGMPAALSPNSSGFYSAGGEAALIGPADGPFPLPLPIDQLEDPAMTPGRTAQITPLSGWTPSIAGLPNAKWISTGASGATDGGSMIVTETHINYPFPFNQATLTFTFACDDSIGEPGVAGLYICGHPVPGTEGVGRPDALTIVGPIDAMPYLRARNIPNSMMVYVSDHAGGSGALFRVNLNITTIPVSYCDVSGLDTRAGFGNISVDPLFTNLAGPDGVRGTADDDFALSPGSPAVDAGDAYSIDYDFADADMNAVTLERIGVDLLGSARRVNGVPGVAGAGRGEPYIDMGAVELEPSNSATARCRADFSGDGRVSVQDIFDFLSAWFNHEAAADFDQSGVVSVQDIFSFLIAWFAGCP